MAMKLCMKQQSMGCEQRGECRSPILLSSSTCKTSCAYGGEHACMQSNARRCADMSRAMKITVPAIVRRRYFVDYPRGDLRVDLPFCPLQVRRTSNPRTFCAF